MSNTRNIKAGAAYVEMYVDKDNLDKGLNQSKAKISAWGAAVGAIGAAAAAPWGLAAAAFVKTREAASGAAAMIVSGMDSAGKGLQVWGSEITGAGIKLVALGAPLKALLAGAVKTFEEMGTAAQRMSDKTGVSVEALSTLGYAARQTGADADSLAGTIAGMRNTLGGVGDGAKEGQAALKKMGVDIHSLAGLSADDQFRKIADRLAGISDPAKRAAAATAIFGSSARGLLPLIAQGAEGMKLLEDDARSLGLEMSGKDAKSALSLHNALSRLWETVKMATFAIGAPLADAMREMVDTGTAIVSTVSKWIRENGALIVSADRIATALTIGGTALTIFGGLVSGAGVVLTEMAVVVGAILSPIGLLTAAVAGLGYYFVTYTQQGAAAMKWLSDKFFELKADALAAFGGIADALSVGDLGLAMKVAGALLNLEWTKALNFMNEKWVAFKFKAIDIAADIATGIAGAFIDGFAVIHGLWADLLGKLSVSAETLRNFMPALDNKPNADAMKKDMVGKITGIQAGLNRNKGKEIHDAANANTDAEQKALDEAIADAKEAKKTRKRNLPTEGPAPAGAAIFDVAADAAKQAKASPGLGFEDARSTGGFKAVAAALRQGRDTPQERGNKLLEELKSLSTDQWRFQKDIRDRFGEVVTVGF